MVDIVKEKAKNIIITPNQIEMKRLMTYLNLPEMPVTHNEEIATDELNVREVSINDEIVRNACAVS